MTSPKDRGQSRRSTLSPEYLAELAVEREAGLAHARAWREQMLAHKGSLVELNRPVACLGHMPFDHRHCGEWS